MGLPTGAVGLCWFQLADLAANVWALPTAPLNQFRGDTQWLPEPLAGNAAAILVAGAIWVMRWWTVQRRVAADEDEQRSVLRKVYLYGMTLQTVAVTLATSATFLDNLFRAVWGTDPVAGTGDSLLTAAGRPCWRRSSTARAGPTTGGRSRPTLAARPSPARLSPRSASSTTILSR